MLVFPVIPVMNAATITAVFMQLSMHTYLFYTLLSRLFPIIDMALYKCIYLSVDSAIPSNRSHRIPNSNLPGRSIATSSHFKIHSLSELYPLARCAFTRFYN